jgi:hypothetical protein
MYGGMAVMMSVIWVRLGYKASTINDRLSVHFYAVSRKVYSSTRDGGRTEHCTEGQVAFLSFMSVAGIPSCEWAIYLTSKRDFIEAMVRFSPGRKSFVQEGTGERALWTFTFPPGQHACEPSIPIRLFRFLHHHSLLGYCEFVVSAARFDAAIRLIHHRSRVYIQARPLSSVTWDSCSLPSSLQRRNPSSYQVLFRSLWLL